MHKAIQTMVAFFAGIFGIKPKVAETPVNRRLPARIAVYSAPMNRAQRRAYAARVAIVERTLSTYLDRGYNVAVERFNGPNVHTALAVYRRTEAGQSFPDACKAELLRAG